MYHSSTLSIEEANWALNISLHSGYKYFYNFIVYIFIHKFILLSHYVQGLYNKWKRRKKLFIMVTLNLGMNTCFNLSMIKFYTENTMLSFYIITKY